MSQFSEDFYKDKKI